MSKDQQDAIREYLKKIARKGGKARAAKYDKATLSKWARKGGRPPNRKESEQ
jgi:general stress protein YciG